MKLPAKAGGDFEVAPAGNHIAICNAIVDLGLQPGSGMYPDPKHQVYLRFELPTEQTTYQKDGQTITGPMSIGRSFTASMSEKANLRKLIESWFGKRFPTDEAAADFDLQALLGRKCLLNVTHADKGGKKYANINNATPIPKGMAADYTQHNKSLYFSLSEPDAKAFDALPKWIKEKIEGRLEEHKAHASSSASNEMPPYDDAPFDDSDIPF